MADEHKALAVFIGDWIGDGTSYDAEGQPSPWRSTNAVRWHSGEYFIVQDERANGPFDTMSFVGWDPERGTYFSWSVENHGFSREYLVSVEADTWTFTGDQERATLTFSDEGRTLTHRWEYRPKGEWVALCDRVDSRV